MRDWINLFEMPMASFNLHGRWNLDTPDPSTPPDLEVRRPYDSFVDRHDRRLASNPRIQERVSDLLLRFQVPIHIHMWNGPGAWFFYDELDYQKIDDRALRRLPNDLRTIVARRSADEITVVLAHNEGGTTKHPLSPWMILHRVAHALDGTGGAKTIFQFTKIKDALFRLYTQKGYTEVFPDKYYFAVEFLNSICTFKAAREGKVLLDSPSYGEGFTEMLVQYMVKGHVPFNPTPNTLMVHGIEYEANDLARVNIIADNFKKWVNDYYAEVVKNAIGGAFIC